MFKIIKLIAPSQLLVRGAVCQLSAWYIVE